MIKMDVFDNFLSTIVENDEELIYDASCPNGIPGCASPFFDYQHIPMRYFEPLYTVQTGASGGFFHEASWLNDGPSPVWFGATSDDEMMVLVMMYLTDTTGLISNTEEVIEALESITDYGKIMILPENIQFIHNFTE